MSAAADLQAAIEGFTTAVLGAGPLLLLGCGLLLGVVLVYGLGRR
jgi:hypothetical protein